MKLNAGCGNDFWGDIRIDIDPDVKALTHIMDIQQMSFPDQTFTETRCISILEHVSNPRKALSELCRVTKQKLIIEVPVNSDLRKTDALRFLFPTPKNIRLLRNLPMRARETLWQFNKPVIIAEFLESRGFKVSWGKIIKIYHSFPSRCFRFNALRITK